MTALVFGLIPALQASRPRLSETLKEGGRSATAGGARLRLRRGLVIGEMALALPLLVAAALSVLTVDRFLNGPQGFNPEGLLTMRLLLPDARYPRRCRARARSPTMPSTRLRTIPGVDSAAAVNIMPAANNNSGRSIEIDGVPNPDPSNPPSADYRTATPATLRGAADSDSRRARLHRRRSRGHPAGRHRQRIAGPPPLAERAIRSASGCAPARTRG